MDTSSTGTDANEQGTKSEPISYLTNNPRLRSPPYLTTHQPPPAAPMLGHPFPSPLPLTQANPRLPPPPETGVVLTAAPAVSCRTVGGAWRSDPTHDQSETSADKDTTQIFEYFEWCQRRIYPLRRWSAHVNGPRKRNIRVS